MSKNLFEDFVFVFESLDFLIQRQFFSFKVNLHPTKFLPVALDYRRKNAKQKSIFFLIFILIVSGFFYVDDY